MKPRLLIVDDALIIRRRIKDIATEAGWEIAGEGSNGEEAATLYTALKPDLVTLDIVMPNVDGVSALKRIVDMDPNARVIMVSAVDQKEKLTECIQAGALDFVVKPFDKAGLLGLLESQLQEITAKQDSTS